MPSDLSLLGARELDRLMAEHVENPVIELLAKRNTKSAQTAQLVFRNESFQLVRTRPQTKTLQHA